MPSNEGPFCVTHIWLEQADDRILEENRIARERARSRGVVVMVRQVTKGYWMENGDKPYLSISWYRG